MYFVLIAQLLAAEPVNPPPRDPGSLKPIGPTKHQTPWYLPRSGAVVLQFAGGAISPGARLLWELDLIEQPRNFFVFTVQVGGAYSLATPTGLGSFYQFAPTAGFGYRMVRESGLVWGLDAGFGPAFYGFRGGPVVENRIAPYIEGRAHLGYRFESKVSVSACAGYGQWISYDQRSLAQPLLGGGFFGVQLGWK